MKFKFRLEGLLRHRKNIEQNALREMIEAQNILESAQRELNQLYESIDDARKVRFSNEVERNFAAETLTFYESFIDGQKSRIESQKQVIRERQMVFEDQQEKYRKAAIDLKTVEKIKEKKMAEFKKERSKLEQKNLDEMIITRFKREKTI